MAGKAALLMSSVLGLHEQPEPAPQPGAPRPGSDPWTQAAVLAVLVLRARRGEAEWSRVVSGVAWWLSSLLPPGLLSEASRKPLRPPAEAPDGFRGLVSACVEYAAKPSVEGLERVAYSVAREVSRPCSRDPRLESERARLESSMRKLGLILGLTLPALFLASLVYNPLLAIASVAVAAAIWGAVRRVGARFRELNIESSWTACTMRPEEVQAAVLGRDMPSLMDLLGVGGEGAGRNI